MYVIDGAKKSSVSLILRNAGLFPAVSYNNYEYSKEKRERENREGKERTPIMYVIVGPRQNYVID
jgi:hypothetical protein